jgi:hypothetical protein
MHLATVAMYNVWGVLCGKHTSHARTHAPCNSGHVQCLGCAVWQTHVARTHAPCNSGHVQQPESTRHSCQEKHALAHSDTRVPKAYVGASHGMAPRYHCMVMNSSTAANHNKILCNERHAARARRNWNTQCPRSRLDPIATTTDAYPSDARGNMHRKVVAQLHADLYRSRHTTSCSTRCQMHGAIRAHAHTRTHTHTHTHTHTPMS